MDNHFLRLAIDKAKDSVSQNGFPAGAVVVRNGEVVGEGISIGSQLDDPTSHGEMASIRESCKNLKTSELTDCVLYASMQPCLMCLGASLWSGIPRIVYACPKNKVSDDYYGGHYRLSVINSELVHPIKLIHLTELENESLEVVYAWEKSLN